MAGGRPGNDDVFSFFRSFGGKFRCKCIIKFSRSLNEGHLRFLARAHNFNFKCQVNPSDLFQAQENWKPLFEVNFSKNSTKTIRLFALDFHEVIVDSAFGLINYHLLEISSS